MSFILYFARHTYSTDKAVVIADIVALDVGESLMVMAFEVLCKHVVGMVKGCLLSLI